MGFQKDDVIEAEWEVVEAVAKLIGKNPHWLAKFGSNVVENGRIISWDLRSVGLSSLPDNIGNLTVLERLDLGANMIRELPRSFGNLIQLRSLTINSNVLFPPDLIQLTNLKQVINSDKGSLGGTTITGKGNIQHVLFDKFAEGYYVLRLKRGTEYFRQEELDKARESDRAKKYDKSRW